MLHLAVASQYPAAPWSLLPHWLQQHTSRAGVLQKSHLYYTVKEQRAQVLYLRYMQHLYLLRHGQSQANANQIIAGSHDSPLSTVGVAQAGYAGDTAKRFFQFDLIVSSPMSRALQTAQIIAERIDYRAEKIVVMPDLRERNLGEVEGKSYNQAPHHNGNYEDAENVPGVEPIGDLLARMRGVLSELQTRPEQNILIVAHNGCGRMLKIALNSEPPMAMYNQPRTENAIFYKVA